MKPSILPIFEYLVINRKGEWTTAAQIIRDCYTTCPHKRLSELIAIGYVEKKENPYKKSLRLYRAHPDVKHVYSPGVTP